MDGQKIVRMWVETRLGKEAMNPVERGRRNCEENIELGQALGVTREEAHRIVDHVYDKPAGDIFQELGGAGMTLMGVAEGCSMSLQEATEKELERVFNLPPERFQKRQQENVANGIGE